MSGAGCKSPKISSPLYSLMFYSTALGRRWLWLSRWRKGKNEKKDVCYIFSLWLLRGKKTVSSVQTYMWPPTSCQLACKCQKQCFLSTERTQTWTVAELTLAHLNVFKLLITCKMTPLLFKYASSKQRRIPTNIVLMWSHNNPSVFLVSDCLGKWGVWWKTS